MASRRWLSRPCNFRRASEMKRKSKFPLMETLQSRCACVRACLTRKGRGLVRWRRGYAYRRSCTSLSFTQSSALASFLRTLVLDQLRPCMGPPEPRPNKLLRGLRFLGTQLAWTAGGEGRLVLGSLNSQSLISPLAFCTLHKLLKKKKKKAQAGWMMQFQTA